MDNSSLKPHILLLIANTIWAVDYPLYKIILPDYISPYALTCMTLLLAGFVCLVSFLFVKGEKIRGKDLYKFVVAGILMGVLKKGLLMSGMSMTSPIDASIISTAGPVIVLIVSAIFMMDQITKRKLFGILLGIAGTLIVVLYSGSQGKDYTRMWGNIIVFSGTLASSFYYVWLKDIVKQYQPLTIMRWMYMMAALFVLPFSFHYLPKVDFSAMTPGIAAIVAFVTIVPTLMPNYFVILSSRYVKPTIVSVYGYIQPVIATAVSVMIGLDVLVWQQVLAGIVVFIGVYFVIRSYGPGKITPLHHMN